MAARSNPERQVRVHHGTVASVNSAMETMPVITDDCTDHASQAHILKVMASHGTNGL